MEDRKCLNCFFAQKVFAMNDCVCSIRGVVDKDFVCKKHQFNMFGVPKPKIRAAKAYAEDKFKIE